MKKLIEEFPHLFTDAFKRELSKPTYHLDGVTRRASAAKLASLDRHFNAKPDTR